MSSTVTNASVALIDDNEELLGELHSDLEALLKDDAIEIRAWAPKPEEDPLATLGNLVDENTVLVVTDHDLTAGGATGLFGSVVVNWCQSELIPVGDFSRAVQSNLPHEPNLFELRVPQDATEAALFVAMAFRGFRDVREALSDGTIDIDDVRSPAETLAELVGKSDLEGHFALYMSRLGASNSSLIDRLRAAFGTGDRPAASEKARILAYVVGHVLLNAVLRYPGPILSTAALGAYLGTDPSDNAELQDIFTGAQFEGAFASANSAFYWRSGVDEVVDGLVDAIGDEAFETSGAFRRAVVERQLGKELPRHECERCGGVNGGYLCPFTKRTVCERPDCSEAANSWIPAGADLCRIERDFYEEWEPLIGL